VAGSGRAEERLEMRGQSVGPEGGNGRAAEDVAEALSRCNIQVSVRQVDRSSHHFSLGLEEARLEGDPGISGQGPGRSAFSRPLTLAWSQSGRDGGGSPGNNSSSDDDESVWYEYGCV